MDRMNVFSSGKDKARERVLFKFRLFYNAVETLEDACAQPYNVYIRDAVIKRFEYTYEMAKGLLHSIFQERLANIPPYPKDIFREALSRGWIEDAVLWEDIVYDRNTTTHQYFEAKADSVYGRITKIYLEEFKKLRQVLKEYVENAL